MRTMWKTEAARVKKKRLFLIQQSITERVLFANLYKNGENGK
jgi:hypothetical protein